MLWLALLHLLFIAYPIIGGIRRGQSGDVGAVVSKVIAEQIGVPAILALGVALLAIFGAGGLHSLITPQAAAESRFEGWRSYFCGIILLVALLEVSGPLLLLTGLALVWSGWAATLTTTLRLRDWLGVALLCIAVLPLIAVVAYADYAWEVFGVVIPFGDIAETVRNASPGSVPTSYVDLNPWIVGALALVTPLPIIAYGKWRLRRARRSLRAASRAR